MKYTEFLQSKEFRVLDAGFEVLQESLNPVLRPDQKDKVTFLLRKGRALDASDTGLGKTPTQIEWAYWVNKMTNTPVVLIVPLSVVRQTVKMARDLMGIEINHSRDGSGIINGINITNYEMMPHFNPDQFSGVGFDESSIFKGEGATFKLACEMWKDTPYKTGYSATQAPNSTDEIGAIAAVLGIIKSHDEMRSEFFINRGKKSNNKWVLKELGRENFYRWMSSWCVSMRKPSDLGYDDTGFDLPKLHISPRFIDAGYVPKGMLFMTKAGGIGGKSGSDKNGIDRRELSRSAIYRGTMEQRIDAAYEIASTKHLNEQGIVWCLRNHESKELSKRLGDQAAEVTGSMSVEEKVQAFEDFQDGKYRILVTKPKIGARGMNFQNASFQVWAGIDDSWEQWKQGVARVHRFGQERECFIYPIIADAQRDVWNNLMYKDRENNKQIDELITASRMFSMNELHGQKTQISYQYEERIVEGKNWKAMLGDSAETIKGIKSDSIGLIHGSEPFAELFTYTPTERDLGNCRDWDEFFEHFSFLIKELYRVLMPGRNAVIHVMDIPARKNKDGFIGMRDFSGRTIDAFIKGGFNWYGGRVFIGKNQQAKSITSHIFGLGLTSDLPKDSARCRTVIPDQLLVFKKGHHNDNKVPVKSNVRGEVSRDDFIKWAGSEWIEPDKFFTNASPEQMNSFAEMCRTDNRPGAELLPDFIEAELMSQDIDDFFQKSVFWDDIRETDVLGPSKITGTLGKRQANGKLDEKHICPLQLEVIRRAIILYSNPGEIVYDPFGGIGSTGYVALQEGRKALLGELKKSYFRILVNNMRYAEVAANKKTLFDMSEF